MPSPVFTPCVAPAGLVSPTAGLLRKSESLGSLTSATDSRKSIEIQAMRWDIKSEEISGNRGAGSDARTLLPSKSPAVRFPSDDNSAATSAELDSSEEDRATAVDDRDSDASISLQAQGFRGTVRELRRDSKVAEWIRCGEMNKSARVYLW